MYIYKVMNTAAIVISSILGVYLTGAVVTGAIIWCMAKNHVGQVAEDKCKPILLQSALWPILLCNLFVT